MILCKTNDFARIVCIYLLIICQLEAVKIADDSNVNRNSSLSSYRGRSLKAADWCALNCGAEKHVACEYGGDCKLDAPCELGKLDPATMVGIHNDLRNTFAMGHDTHAKGVEVANMLALEWDDDLALLAACNLKKCTGEMAHDQCHTTPKFKTAGQNLAWSSGVDDCVKNSHEGFPKSWYEEIEMLSVAQIKAKSENYAQTPGTGHFTQVVWAETSHIGCAVAKKVDANVICVLACNYGPAGNVLTTSMFMPGSPGSKCPAGTESISKYPGLCGKNGVNRNAPMLITILFISLFRQIIC